jgi:hypothetical protein
MSKKTSTTTMVISYGNYHHPEYKPGKKISISSSNDQRLQTEKHHGRRITLFKKTYTK